MTAHSAVADGKLTNEELGALTRRCDEIKRRLNEGTLPLPLVMRGLQHIIEGCPADRFLRDELSVSEPTRSWREADGVIYFSVTSDGTTGEDWIKRLEGNGFCVGNYAKQVLRSPRFLPTSGVTTEVAVLKGMLFEDDDRITRKIRAEGALRKLGKLNAEIACLIREKFTDDELEIMGLIWIVAMHEPINDSGGGPDLLGAHRYGSGRWLSAYYDGPAYGWNRGSGFAFAVSQVSFQH
jgi:hypothetical protein